MGKRRIIETFQETTVGKCSLSTKRLRGMASTGHTAPFHGSMDGSNGWTRLRV